MTRVWVRWRQYAAAGQKWMPAEKARVGGRVGAPGVEGLGVVSLSRSFAGLRHLAGVTPHPCLPHGVNMDFHLYHLPY